MRRLTEWAVYGFLRWFESFDSVWQTTLAIFGGWAFELAYPTLDPGHLVFLLVLSLYATFTQNGLGHGNKLTAQKVDAALETIDRIVDDLYVATQTLIQMARSESSVQEALLAQTAAVAAQTELIVAALSELPPPGGRAGA